MTPILYANRWSEYYMIGFLNYPKHSADLSEFILNHSIGSDFYGQNLGLSLTNRSQTFRKFAAPSLWRLKSEIRPHMLI